MNHVSSLLSSMASCEPAFLKGGLLGRCLPSPTGFTLKGTKACLHQWWIPFFNMRTAPIHPCASLAVSKLCAPGQRPPHQLSLLGIWISALTLCQLNQKLQGEPDDLGFSKLLQSNSSKPAWSPSRRLCGGKPG